jgi:hypothetical protein
MQQGWSALKPKPGDRVELRVVDPPLARALFHGIPAARLLARVRLASDEQQDGDAWDTHLARLLVRGSAALDRVKRAVARHSRVAFDEGPLQATEATIAVLAWAVASEDGSDQSLSEIAPAAGQPSRCDDAVLAACAAYDERIASSDADKRAPAFEACVRMATRSAIGPMPWEQLRAIAAQLERPPIGVQLFRDGSQSIFPRRVDDEIAYADRRVAPLERAQLDELVSQDPRELGSAVWRTNTAPGGDAGTQLATFLADLTRLLAQEGQLVAAIVPLQPPDEEETGDARGAPPSWVPTDWSARGAAALADALERGATTFPRARTEVVRGGSPALDAIGAEMLHVGAHPFASAGFAEILARSARPRDVIRLVTYFAVAPDPTPAARALSGCSAPELPRVLGAWLEAMLPQDGDDPGSSSAERVTACIAALKPYPQLYRAVHPLLSRVADAPPPSAH